MRYYLVDRIIQWSAWKEIRGVKNVAMSEDFLEFHFPKRPIMPGVLLLESMTQLAGLLAAASSGYTKWFLINSVKSSKFYGFAFPGDQVEITVEIRADEEGAAVCTGIAAVSGRKKVTAEFGGELVALAELDNPAEQERLFTLLSRE